MDHGFDGDQLLEQADLSEFPRTATLHCTAAGSKLFLDGSVHAGRWTSKNASIFSSGFSHNGTQLFHRFRYGVPGVFILHVLKTVQDDASSKEDARLMNPRDCRPRIEARATRNKTETACGDHQHTNIAVLGQLQLTAWQCHDAHTHELGDNLRRWGEEREKDPDTPESVCVPVAPERLGGFTQRLRHACQAELALMRLRVWWRPCFLPQAIITSDRNFGNISSRSAGAYVCARRHCNPIAINRLMIFADACAIVTDILRRSFILHLVDSMFHVMSHQPQLSLVPRLTNKP